MCIQRNKRNVGAHIWFIKNKQMLCNLKHESNKNKSKVHKRHTPAGIPLRNHKHENTLRSFSFAQFMTYGAT
jgi:hypothetical protein